MALTPAQIARRYPDICLGKTSKSLAVTLSLSILGGMFIGLAAFAANMISAMIADAGLAKLVSALLFPAGLGMILIAGGELFTGNCMLPLGVYTKKITLVQLLRNWGIVFAGNFIGALLIAALSVYSRRQDAAFLAATLAVAEGKASLSFGEVFVRGILCNILVCTAVWMSYAAGSTGGKLLGMYFPVVLFVLCGTEHCVANMYYFPAAFLAGASQVTWPGFLLGSLVPATLGNIVGGGVLLCGLLWLSLFDKKA